MAKASSNTGTAATAAASGEPQYFEVTLNKVAVVEGHRYLPGTHVADEATVAAMGDAVANKRPVTL